MVASGVEEPPAAGLIWADVSPEQQVSGRSEACDGSDLPSPRSADGGRGVGGVKTSHEDTRAAPELVGPGSCPIPGPHRRLGGLWTCSPHQRDPRGGPLP